MCEYLCMHVCVLSGQVGINVLICGFMSFDGACQSLGPQTPNVPFSQGRVVARATGAVATQGPPWFGTHLVFWSKPLSLSLSLSLYVCFSLFQGMRGGPREGEERGRKAGNEGSREGRREVEREGGR